MGGERGREGVSQGEMSEKRVLLNGSVGRYWLQWKYHRTWPDGRQRFSKTVSRESR